MTMLFYVQMSMTMLFYVQKLKLSSPGTWTAGHRHSGGGLARCTKRAIHLEDPTFFKYRYYWYFCTWNAILCTKRKIVEPWVSNRRPSAFRRRPCALHQTGNSLGGSYIFKAYNTDVILLYAQTMLIYVHIITHLLPTVPFIAHEMGYSDTV